MSLSQPKNTEIAIRCIGALGQLAMRNSVSNEENESIGSAFISQLKENEISKLTGSNIGEIDLVSQILDTLFDVYGDETRAYEGVVDKLGLVKVLEAMLPTFKRLVSSSSPICTYGAFEDGKDADPFVRCISSQTDKIR